MTTALIADDEPLLCEHLREKLAKLWPELLIIGEASNGNDAAQMIAALQPDIAFLDIKMPGQTGIEVAQGIETTTRIVFVTAYDEYALAAFDSEAVDYVLKPVADARLQQTVTRLQKALAEQSPMPDISAILNLLARAGDGGGGSGGGSPADVNNAKAAKPLRWIRASRGDTTYQIAADEVLFFQSDDKYTVVNTANGEHLIGKSLTEMARSLDSEFFWQIHRGTIINVRFVASTKRDRDGHMVVNLKGFPKALAVSRAYQHLFRQS
jgi:DNA-binding LytR/AlgR family response regulator